MILLEMIDWISLRSAWKYQEPFKNELITSGWILSKELCMKIWIQLSLEILTRLWELDITISKSWSASNSWQVWELSDGETLNLGCLETPTSWHTPLSSDLSMKTPILPLVWSDLILNTSYSWWIENWDTTIGKIPWSFRVGTSSS